MKVQQRKKRHLVVLFSQVKIETTVSLTLEKLDKCYFWKGKLISPDK